MAKKLRPFLHQLRPLAQDAQPTVRDLANLVKKSGPNNDLIDLTKSNVPVRNAAIGPVQANGASREGAFPASTKALEGATPELASARPYAPDLVGWFDDYSHSGTYDALGGYSRAQTVVNLFTIVNGLPDLGAGIIPAAARAGAFDAAAQVGQNNRCPGSIERNPGDGSAPFAPANVHCDPTEVPPPGS